MCGREHHPMLHLSRSSYCMATALPTGRKPLPSQAEPGGPATIRKSSASLFAVLNVPVRAVGGLRSDVALMLEDNGASKNFVIHALAEKLKLARAPTTMFIRVIERESSGNRKRTCTCWRWWHQGSLPSNRGRQHQLYHIRRSGGGRWSNSFPRGPGQQRRPS